MTPHPLPPHPPTGISRDTRHKRNAAGGRFNTHQKKRKFEMGRQPAMTRIGEKQVNPVRGRGGNMKDRALRLESGNFSWGTEACTRRVRVVDVVYNASNNELVRTKTLVKGAIVAVDSAPFRQFFEQRYGLGLGKGGALSEAVKISKSQAENVAARGKHRVLDSHMAEEFKTGRLLAKIASRPGQSGRCDGYLLEGKELEFYQRQVSNKKKH